MCICWKIGVRIAKSGSIGQDQMAKTCEGNYEEIANCNGLNRSSQIFNFDIYINIFHKILIYSLSEI